MIKIHAEMNDWIFIAVAYQFRDNDGAQQIPFRFLASSQLVLVRQPISPFPNPFILSDASFDCRDCQPRLQRVVKRCQKFAGWLRRAASAYLFGLRHRTPEY